jgi:hypothetical protein
LGLLVQRRLIQSFCGALTDEGRLEISVEPNPHLPEVPDDVREFLVTAGKWRRYAQFVGAIETRTYSEGTPHTIRVERTAERIDVEAISKTTGDLVVACTYPTDAKNSWKAFSRELLLMVTNLDDFVKSHLNSEAEAVT